MFLRCIRVNWSHDTLNTDAVPRWRPKLEINREKLLWCFSWIMRAFYMMIQQSSPCSPLIFVGAFSLPTSVIFMLLNDSFLLVGTLNVTLSVCPLGIKRKRREKDLKSPTAASAVGQTYLSARAGEESTSKPHNTVQTWNEHESQHAKETKEHC